MKTSHFLTAALGVLLVGCGENSDKPAQPTNAPAASSGSVLTAPVDYLGALGKAQQTAVKQVDLASAKQAIQMFQVDHGRFPKDLNELVAEKYLGKLPTDPYGMKIVYDPNTGQVSAVKK